jgi:SAM-dependent methyltransferase
MRGQTVMPGGGAMAGAGRTFVHEASYQGLRPSAWVHRARLARLLALFEGLELPATGSAADFGCSNGFVLELLRKRFLPVGRWELSGFDYQDEYLRQAAQKQIGGTFRQLDLNHVQDPPPGSFDLVLCLETLEHTGNYRNAVRNLARSCRPGAQLLISVPNENRLPGIAKFVGRAICRPRNPYLGFFEHRSVLGYSWALLTNQDLERFRQPAQNGWGPHLGFDIDGFEAFLHSELLAAGDWTMLRRESSACDFNRFYLLRREACVRRGRPAHEMASAAAR